MSFENIVEVMDLGENPISWRRCGCVRLGSLARMVMEFNSGLS